MQRDKFLVAGVLNLASANQKLIQGRTILWILPCP